MIEKITPRQQKINERIDNIENRITKIYDKGELQDSSSSLLKSFKKQIMRLKYDRS
jgi:hypothetical protein